MTDCTTLTVTSNADNGPNTLRWAIQESQKTEGGCYNIVFDDKSGGEQTGNKIKLGYFTIPLESPLPNIYRNEVNINPLNYKTHPRAVTLIPKYAISSFDILPKPIKYVVPTQDKPKPNEPASGSLMHIGDVNEFLSSKLDLANPYRTFDKYSGAAPKVSINNFTFSKNISRGQDAQSEHGAGGAYGVGGGITISRGEVNISNSLFQNLQAAGGKGATSAAGGQSSWQGKCCHNGDRG